MSRGVRWTRCVRGAWNVTGRRAVSAIRCCCWRRLIDPPGSRARCTEPRTGAWWECTTRGTCAIRRHGDGYGAGVDPEACVSLSPGPQALRRRWSVQAREAGVICWYSAQRSCTKRPAYARRQMRSLSRHLHRHRRPTAHPQGPARRERHSLPSMLALARRCDRCAAPRGYKAIGEWVDALGHKALELTVHKRRPGLESPCRSTIAHASLIRVDPAQLDHQKRRVTTLAHRRQDAAQRRRTDVDIA